MFLNKSNDLEQISKNRTVVDILQFIVMRIFENTNVTIPKQIKSKIIFDVFNGDSFLTSFKKNISNNDILNETFLDLQQNISNQSENIYKIFDDALNNTIINFYIDPYIQCMLHNFKKPSIISIKIKKCNVSKTTGHRKARLLQKHGLLIHFEELDNIKYVKDTTSYISLFTDVEIAIKHDKVIISHIILNPLLADSLLFKKLFLLESIA